MAGRSCRCGCQQPVPFGRVFVDKEHQLDWMFSGGAREMNRLQPVEGKRRGGAVAGQQAVISGHLARAGQRGAARSRAIATRFKSRRGLT